MPLTRKESQMTTKVKKITTKKEQINYWQQLHLQAKTDGNTRLMKLYEALIIKLGGTILKL